VSLNLKLNLSGGTLSGNLGIRKNPSESLDVSGNALVSGTFAVGTTSNAGYSTYIKGGGDVLYLESTGANYAFRSQSTSGYTTTLNMDDTGLSVGHNSTSRAIMFNQSTNERMRIHTNGHVGIGTNSPLQPLQVDRITGSSTTTNTTGIDQQHVVMVLKHQTSHTARKDAGIMFMNNGATSSNISYASGLIKSGWDVATFWNASYIDFQTHGNNTSDWTTDMRIRGGNVGIGKTEPSQRLDVSGNALISGLMNVGESALPPEGITLNCNGAFRATDVIVGMSDVIVAGGVGVLNGSIGIGVAIPSQKLDVSGNIALGHKWNGALTADVILGKTDAYGTWGNGSCYINFKDSTNSPLTTNSGTSMIFNTHKWGVSTAEAMRIAGNGNVGIGTTNPEVKLTINTTDGDVNTSTAGCINMKNGITNRLRLGFDATCAWIQSYDAKPLCLNPGGNNVGIGLFSASQTQQIRNGDQSKTLYGGNTQGKFLEVGAGASAVTADKSQMVCTNGNLHIDSSTSGSILLNFNSQRPIICGDSVTLSLNSVQATFKLQLPNISSDIGGRGRAQSWTTYSDDRIKSQEVEIPYGLIDVLKMKPMKYIQHNSTNDASGNIVVDESCGVHSIGFIAQELLSVVPEVVSVPENEEKDLYSVDYNKLIPVLTKAIQELNNKVEELQARLNILEN
jgi:hypothetical protein